MEKKEKYLPDTHSYLDLCKNPLSVSVKMLNVWETVAEGMLKTLEI